MFHIKKYKPFNFLIALVSLLGLVTFVTPSAPVAHAAVNDKCNTTNCVLVCGDGTVIAEDKSKSPAENCTGHNGAQLSVSKSIECKSDSNCDANFYNHAHCTVTCGDLKSTEDIDPTTDGGAFDPDPIAFCKGNGDVAVIINKDGSTADKGGQSPGVSGNIGCGPNQQTTDTSGCGCKAGDTSSVCGVDPAVTCSTDSNGNCDLIGQYLNPAITVLTASFGLLAVISIILGAINYVTSEGDPQKAGKAKRRIANTVIAVIAYMFFYAFMQFIIPGGAFK